MVVNLKSSWEKSFCKKLNDHRLSDFSRLSKGFWLSRRSQKEVQQQQQQDQEIIWQSWRIGHLTEGKADKAKPKSFHNQI